MPEKLTSWIGNFSDTTIHIHGNLFAHIYWSFQLFWPLPTYWEPWRCTASLHLLTAARLLVLIIYLQECVLHTTQANQLNLNMLGYVATCSTNNIPKGASVQLNKLETDFNSYQNSEEANSQDYFWPPDETFTYLEPTVGLFSRKIYHHCIDCCLLYMVVSRLLTWAAVSTVFFDISYAFDTVPHLEKLEKSCVRICSGNLHPVHIPLDTWFFKSTVQSRVQSLACLQKPLNTLVH